MTHLNEGQLRAYLDGELAGKEIQHLEGCLYCQQQLKEVKYLADFAHNHLSEFLTSPVQDQSNSQQELVHIQQRLNKKEKLMFQNFYKNMRMRTTAVVLAISLLLVIVFTVPPIRASAAQFLSIFRAQKVAVLPINSETINKISGNERFIQKMQEMMSGDMEIVKEASESQPAADAVQASSMAGFNVRFPETELPTRQIWVEDSSTFNMTINRDHIQAVLQELDYNEIVLPESLEGQKITFEVPSGIRAYFGVCTALGADVSDENPIETSCYSLYEIPSPRIETPDGLDLNQLMGVALELTGMTREQAAAYAQTFDLASSLVIPVPTDVASYSTVQVDGVEGQLLQHIGSDNFHAVTLIWVKDGVIYDLTTTSKDPSGILELANHMK